MESQMSSFENFTKYYWIRILVLIIVVLVIILCASVAIYKKISGRKYSLAGKLVLITGSGNGLGRELSLAFARENCRLVCVDIDEQGNKETVEQIKKISSSTEVLSFNVDITDSNQIKELRQKILSQFNSGVDILINNAGICFLKTITEITEEQSKKLINVNLLSHIWTIKTFLPDMLAKDNGVIVAIASLCVKTPGRKLAVYATTKWGVAGLMESVRHELLLRQSNVKTLTVFPGAIATKLTPVKRYQKPGLVWENYIPIVVIDPRDLAVEIIEAIKNGKSELVSPYINSLFLRFLFFISPYVHSLVPVMKIKENKDI